MRKSRKQTPSGLQVPGDTSLVSCTTSCAQADVPVLTGTKPARQPRRENTRDGRGRMSAHSVFVLGLDGKPITPTTPAKARKLLEGGQAKKAWSKFGTFGIQMLVETRKEAPLTVLGYDPGTKFEGFSIVCGIENSLSIKLDLPNKQDIMRKMKERKNLRNSRRRRGRRRYYRAKNRRHTGYIAPSQLALVGSRLKILKELFKRYPVSIVGKEDSSFDHSKYRYGANFTSMEIGKTRLSDFFVSCGARTFSFDGKETKGFRLKFNYFKTESKSADIFGAHCADSLSLACEIGPGRRVDPGQLLVVDDTYRPVRRKLHYTQFAPGGVRRKYSTGNVSGLRKGILVGTPRGKTGLFCGVGTCGYRYYDRQWKRQNSRKLSWVSSQFLIRTV